MTDFGFSKSFRFANEVLYFNVTMPLKKKNSAAEHWYGAFFPHKESESMTSTEPWTDLYAPQDLVSLLLFVSNFSY